MRSTPLARLGRASLAALLLLLVVACGGDDDAAAPASTSTAPSSSTTTAQVAIEVFLLPATTGTDCGEVVAVPREAPDSGVLRSAMAQLLAGPTEAELGAGLRSWFSAETAGMLNDVSIRQGVAHVDFDDFSGLLPNASTSCGSTSLLAQLDHTAQQFDTVDRAVYSFNGSTATFYEWLQLAPPEA